MKLDDLKPKQVDVQIIENGQVIHTIPMRSLSIHEWNEIGYSVENPLPPKKKKLTAGAVSNEGYDYEDPDYLSEARQANEERQYRRLAVALHGGGAFDELNGLDPEAQANLIRGLDIFIINALTSALMQIVARGESRIESLVATFPEQSLSSDDGLPEKRLDFEPVENTG